VKLNIKNSSRSALHFGYKTQRTEETINAIFLGLKIDNHISRKNDSEEMIPKLTH